MKKIAVILSGSGVYDGSEIHEAVATLLSIAQNGWEYQCFAPNKNQYHVINHLTGDVQEETRHVMVESARIARGNVQSLDDLAAIESCDALVIPGGFGAAKNLNQWAIKGAEGEIDSTVKAAILAMLKANKPLVALCMGPTVVAKALENSGMQALLTVGSTAAASPYDIAGISAGMESLGAKVANKQKHEVAVDETLRIVTAPCYMMEATIKEVFANAKQAIDVLKKWL